MSYVIYSHSPLLGTVNELDGLPLLAGAPDGQKMIGADIVIATLVGGQPSVASYQADAHQPPRRLNSPAAGGTSSSSNNLRVVRFERGGGRTLVEFERPLAASSGGPAGPGVAIALEGPNTFIVARGIDDNLNYHGYVDSLVKISPASRYNQPLCGAANMQVVPCPLLLLQFSLKTRPRRELLWQCMLLSVA